MPAAVHPDSLVRQSGAIVFPENRIYAEEWDASGGSVKQASSGHWILYDRHGRRFLYADPEGTILHECAWNVTPSGLRLRAVRLQLDWGQWVGIKPEGLVNRTVFNLSKRPGWQSMTRDDLRRMAAQAMNTSLETVRFFYPDEDLIIHPSGEAIIRQRKDAFYVLSEGRFDGAKFMSCMSRMNWHAIDYLPVVELFLSLLPGTGSATFELIRGLYDDQNPVNPHPLRYRGIPPYPSVGAYSLFSQFFVPSLESGENPLPVFLDPARSHEVLWMPTANPPVRYFKREARLCVTVRGGGIQKVTDANDPTGQPYYGHREAGVGACERTAIVQGGSVILEDGGTRKHIPLDPLWQVTNSSIDTVQKAPPIRQRSWRDCFPLGPPQVTPHEAFSAVLLYPEDDTLTGERESHPFVFDYFDDLLDEAENWIRPAHAAHRVLIDHCDGALGACIRLDAPRNWTIIYNAPAFAQKAALHVWGRLVQQQHLDWASGIQFLPEDHDSEVFADRSFDLIYAWTPFALYHSHLELERFLNVRLRALSAHGFLFLAGPRDLMATFRRYSLEVKFAQLVYELPTFRIHQSILPQARLHPDLTAYIVTT